MSEESGAAETTPKPDYSLLPPEALRIAAEVMTRGLKRYGRDNWRSGYTRDHFYAKVMRHLEAARLGNGIDPESGLPHTAHALCNLMFLAALDFCGDEGAWIRPADVNRVARVGGGVESETEHR